MRHLITWRLWRQHSERPFRRLFHRTLHRYGMIPNYPLTGDRSHYFSFSHRRLTFQASLPSIKIIDEAHCGVHFLLFQCLQSRHSCHDIFKLSFTSLRTPLIPSCTVVFNILICPFLPWSKCQTERRTANITKSTVVARIANIAMRNAIEWIWNLLGLGTYHYRYQ